MDSDITTTATPPQGGSADVDAGAYEVLRRRLSAQAGELIRRAEALNARRTEEFGSTGLRLLATEQVRTGHPAVPRDLVGLGGQLLFGFERGPGARGEAGVDDVLLVRDAGAEDTGADEDAPASRGPRPDGATPASPATRPDSGTPDSPGTIPHGGTPTPLPTLLDDEAFRREFSSLHRYFRDARLLRLRRVNGKLLAVFRTGKDAEDIRVLRWALGADGTPGAFLDAQGERDHVFPASHDFDWTAAGREDHRTGRHPHIAVGKGGGLFVDTLGGTLTVKVTDDTESPDGIYEGPVDEPLQSLADADVEYAEVGPLTLLRVRPYKEESWRHLVFNSLLGSVRRLDGIGPACHRLPEDQGIIFPGGYYLTTGTAKTFDTAEELSEPVFEGAVRSPNGEDVLYVFRSRDGVRSLLLPYNLIRQEVATPLTGRGHALLDDGTLILLRDNPDGPDVPARVHPLQRWQTPFVSDTYAAARPAGTGPLARTGNADLVRGISDCLALAHGVRDMTPTTAVYGQLATDCARAQDRYHWLSDPELGSLGEPLAELRATAQQVLAEFTAVQELTRRAADALEETATRITALVRRVRGEAPGSAAAWVERLTELRQAHGHLATVGEMRYADVERIAELSARTEDDIASAAQRAVSFLAREDAFDGYHAEIAGLVEDAGALATVRDASAVSDRLAAMTDGLATVTDVVAGLEIGDATVRTSILERIAEVLGGANRARATLDARRRELLSKEGRAEFAAEFALLGQAVTGALAAADTPEHCDDQLARLLLQLENLESRFAEFDDFLAELAERRGEVYEAFSARKQTLQDERARRAERLAGSAQRVLETIGRRVAGLDDPDAVHTYFASDPMVAKVRRTADELRELGDPVRAEELDGRLKAARQEAGRALRDRSELYADGGSVIRLGRHRFAVNTQPFDLTLVPSGGRLAFALTGTDYRAPVTDPAFEATRPYWEQLLPSESAAVYRGEYLAARLLEEHGADRLGALSADELAALVRESAAEAYDEGYTRGVHDEDATAVLRALLRLHTGAGLLRHEPAVRAAAQLFWAYGTEEAQRVSWTRRAVSLARARDTFGSAPAIAVLQEEWASAIGGFGGDGGFAFDGGPGGDGEGRAAAVSAYLFEELTGGPGGFVVGSGVRAFLAGFHRAAGPGAYADDLAALGGDLAARKQLVEGWLTPYARSSGEALADGDLAEAVAVELCPELARYGCDAPLTERVDGLLGDHPRIGGGSLTVRIDELLARTGEFRTRAVPGFRAYQRLRTSLVDAERGRLRLDDHRPRVMSAFVRNRLLDEVYLPLIGDSLAKQLGTADADRRTDSQGLLLLVSPPGYGKTTLMEYVADRLGMVLVKISGPNLGHDVTSLDPDRAPSATARQEVEKINFALEAGNNTLLYLDDIQHTSPELLQKFIPLCDATRRIEGVRDGEPRSYDLRGKRFAVCMAGNPYTESGEQFRIPDMLANRADVWNLGEVLSGREDVFALSFVENALTANPVLAPLAGRSREDLALLVRLAGGGDPSARAEHLEHPYSAVELDAVLAVLRHLLTARETVLAVNAAYIASAAQTDATRTEPPFRLQGSYRNMNKIAERIVPVMNGAELSAVVDDHYAGEAQTLTTGAEANLLKLAALRGTLTAEQAGRWAAITSSYVRTQALGGPDGDPMTRAVAALGLLADRIAAVETAIQRAADPRNLPAGPPNHGGTVNQPAGEQNRPGLQNHRAKITNIPQ
ncbi:MULTISPECIES: DNA repair ATPase [unclassified Streptomyces]|uniref:DNA repair ATPase n=1 Tax=unclassified Streptomyces TaxID=2593676 RepID=UPI000823E663|nr:MULTISPECIES: DNA repair ATPase [unclassified Streptomyces]MYT97125.1 AAA family ATPase [Streptomyces sp. SID8350]SCK37015.1 ATPase family associated with various cellular activities (AAA) [Streptomyces sp. AmelKG-D3]